LGFDAEWQERDGRRQVLSYQAFGIGPDGRTWSAIAFPPDGKRVRLCAFVHAVLAKGVSDGALDGYPEDVVLVGHFNVADLTIFADLKRITKMFDALRRTFASVRQPTVWTLYDKNRNAHRVRVILRDTTHLAPREKQKLADLGRFLGLEKIELDAGEIERMSELLTNDRERYIRYALRDAEITARYLVKVCELTREITGEDSVPVTLSSVAISRLLQGWEEAGLDRKSVLGLESVKEDPWDDVKKRIVKRKRLVPVTSRHDYETFATECYHGGRNECFLFGPSETGSWTDCDLQGAYATAMTLLGMPAWERLQTCNNPELFHPCSYGFARVRFCFPPETRFPCLPVRTANGLVFPLEGEAQVAAPELFLAREMNATLEILSGIVIPTSFGTLPFQGFTKGCTDQRRKHQKGTLGNALWKEVGNSLYGKLAQGLRRKRCFDSRSGEHKDMPPSKITNPFLAAQVTSMVRAAVGEILFRLPATVTVASVTTDGFLSTATPEQIQAAASGIICAHLAWARQAITDLAVIWELKPHIVRRVLAWKTRGQATIDLGEASSPVTAMATLKAPPGTPDRNAWVVDKFEHRTGPIPQSIPMFPPISEVCNDGAEMIRKEIKRNVSMEPDFKREPVNPSMRTMGKGNHLFFETQPWRSVQEFTKHREAFDVWKKGRTLKTVTDLRDFQEFLATSGLSSAIKRPHRNPALTLAKRQFLRAFVRGAYRLERGTMSYAELAEWLTNGGYRTSKEDVENAARPSAQLIEHSVPRTEETTKFVAFVQERFSQFDVERFR
jgi:hypothetical protein